MKFRGKAATVALSVAAAGAAITGCGAGNGTYDHAPMAAYGQDNQCYYAYNPAEVNLLMREGLCDPSWAAVRAPASWLDEYYYYYDSPLYYDTFVPAQYRTVYIRTYGPSSTFYRTNRSAITRLSSKAIYYSTSGAKVTHVTGTSRFGSGSSFGKAGQTYGGGGLRKSTITTNRPTARSTSRSGTVNIPGTSGYKPSKPVKSTYGNGGLRKGSSSSSYKRH